LDIGGAIGEEFGAAAADTWPRDSALLFAIGSHFAIVFAQKRSI